MVLGPRVHAGRHRIVGAFGAILFWLFASLLLAGCDPEPQPSALATPTPTPTPGISEITAVGVVVEESDRAPITEFLLQDGRALSYDLSVVRVVERGGGEPRLLVAGRDSDGEWLAVVGHQDGTPPGCHVLNQRGYELGPSIAIAGIRWPKAPTLSWPGQVPPIGQPYPANARFCLDDAGRVNRILPI